MIYAVPHQFEFSDSQPMSGSGYASTLPVEPTNDVVKRLREAVEDVTRKPCPADAPRRIGFV